MPKTQPAVFVVLAALLGLAALGIRGICTARPHNRATDQQSNDRAEVSKPTIITTSQDSGEMRTAALDQFSRMPLLFVENKGQVDSKVKYLARHGGAIAYLLQDGFTLKLSRARQNPDGVCTTPSSLPQPLPMNAVFYAFRNASKECKVEACDLQSGYENYRIGRDPMHWANCCRTYTSVFYKNLYPGIDLKFLERDSKLEYDLIVHDGGDLSNVIIQCDGAGALKIDETGALVGSTFLGELRQEKPTAWVDESTGGRRSVNCEFRLLDENCYGFQVKGVGRNERLTIDPGVLVYGKYLGGSGVDKGWGIAVDRNGNAFVTGETASADYPTAPAAGFTAFDTTLSVPSDVFVTQLNAIGRALVYSTYIGGNGTDVAYAIKVDGRGVAYVCGVTSSTNFYTASASLPGYGGGASDGFIVRFGVSGFPDNGGIVQNPTPPAQYSDFVGWSTLLGGPGADGCRDLALEPVPQTPFPGQNPLNPTFPRILVCGFVGSSWSSISNLLPINQPYIKPNPIPPLNGPTDAFVAQINQQPLLAFTAQDFDYIYYFGGTGDDTARGVDWLPGDVAVVCGVTTSQSMATTGNALQSTFGGGPSDGFVCALQCSFSSYSTPWTVTGTLSLGYLSYLGGYATDEAHGLVTDFNNAAFVVGTTSSPQLATVGAFGGVLNLGAGGSNTDAFVAKFTNFLPFPTPPVTQPYFSYLGGTGNDEGNSIALFNGTDATITGIAGANATPGMGFDFPQTPPNAIGAGPSDVFVTRFNSSGSALAFSFLFGGSLDDYGYAIALDLNGDQYITGVTWSTNLMVTPGVLAPSTVGVALLGPYDAFAHKFH